MRNKLFLIPILLLTACSLQGAPAKQSARETSLPLFSTATLVPTFTPRPTATTAVPTIAPTIAPLMGTLTKQLNVRVGPDKKMTSMGLLDFGTRVQVIGRDASSTWLQIIYPADSNSTGWVTVEFVHFDTADIGSIPKVEYVPPTQDAGATPGQAEASPAAQTPAPAPSPAPKTATVTRQINVRKGPGQTFQALGLLDANTQVTLSGHSQNDIWVQILYKDGVDGKGWVAAAYLSGADLTGLPYFDNTGSPIAAGTPAAAPGVITLTPTAFSPAATDGDSAQSPGAQITFAPDAAGAFSYTSDLSSPNGDDTDWVAITPYEPTHQSTYLYFKLECSGNGGITAVLKKDGQPLPEVKPLVCGNYDFAIQVVGGQEYSLVLTADGSGSVVRYTRYTLYVKSTR